MKRLFVLMSCAVSLNAFASGEPVKPATVQVDMNHATVVQVPAGSKVTVVSAPAPSSVTIQAERPVNERMPFRAGVSTVTVEKLAQALGCVGGQGAGLMTPQGPVELYRMMCESGQVYMAKCELRQCRTVSATPPGGYAAVTANAAIEMRQALRRSEVPGLVIEWRCGNCVQNPDFAAALRQAYAAEAGRNGMSVSNAATATVSVVQYAKHMFPIRSTLAMNAVYGRQAVRVQESATAFTGMNYLTDLAGKKIFLGLRSRNY